MACEYILPTYATFHENEIYYRARHLSFSCHALVLNEKIFSSRLAAEALLAKLTKLKPFYSFLLIYRHADYDKTHDFHDK